MTTVSSADRLGFTLFMAAAIHAVIVLGLSFGLEDKAPPPKTLEVTLATYKSQKKPEDADFLAQLNQQGSGTLEKKPHPLPTEKPIYRTTKSARLSFSLRKRLRLKQRQRKHLRSLPELRARKRFRTVTLLTNPHKSNPKGRAQQADRSASGDCQPRSSAQ